MQLPLDYDILRLIWWLLLGVLLIGLAIMDGFDLGSAILLPWVARNDSERRVVINSVGPFWEGNQVWLILGGGAIFAAWPALYAVSFSGFYIAMFLALFALIIRPVGFKYRSKMPSRLWRSIWDMGLFIGGLVPALIFGVAVGNMFLGVPFHFDDTLRPFYTGSFWGLLSPFGIACGVVSIVMLTYQGAIYLLVKTEGAVYQRLQCILTPLMLAFVVLFSAAGYWVAYHLDGFVITNAIDHVGPSNPLNKTVELVKGGWVHNYKAYPWMMAAPALAYLGFIVSWLFAKRHKNGFAFIFSSAGVFGTVATAGVSAFPFLLPSSSDMGHSLTVWDASSSHLTLFVMFVATLIFMPIVLAYTGFAYRVMRGKVTPTLIESKKEEMY